MSTDAWTMTDAAPTVSRRSSRSGSLTTDAKLEQFRWHMGSQLFGAFAASLFDQVAYPEIAAAVDETGRFAKNFTDRGVRSFSSGELVLWSEHDTRLASAEDLKVKHREVRGKGKGAFEGVRYSALSPQLWNWIALSSMLNPLRSFTACTGIELDDDERRAAYRMMYDKMRILELPGRSAALPATLDEAEDYYAAVVRDHLEPNEFLDDVARGLTKLPLPSIGLPKAARAALAPPWLLVRPAAGHVVKICSSGIMDPRVRSMSGFRWGRAEQLQYAVITRLLQQAWRRLPRRIMLTPMAYHHYRLAQLTREYEAIQLESFAPDGGGCPF